MLAEYIGLRQIERLSTDGIQERLLGWRRMVEVDTKQRFAGQQRMSLKAFASGLNILGTGEVPKLALQLLYDEAAVEKKGVSIRHKNGPLTARGTEVRLNQ